MSLSKKKKKKKVLHFTLKAFIPYLNKQLKNTFQYFIKKQWQSCIFIWEQEISYLTDLDH